MGTPSCQLRLCRLNLPPGITELERNAKSPAHPIMLPPCPFTMLPDWVAGCSCTIWSFHFVLTSIYKQLTQKTWHWTPVVRHGNQTAFMDPPPPLKRGVEGCSGGWCNL